MPKENTPSIPPQRWVERALPDGSRVFGSRVPGEGGTISLLANGKVAVGVSAPAFLRQGRKLIRRFKAHPILFDALENILEPPFDESGSRLLLELVQMDNQTRFDRSLDVLVSTIRALRELRVRQFGTIPSQQFVAAIHKLAARAKRPPTKGELTAELCTEPSRITHLCDEHGFGWLPPGKPGRKRK